MEKFYKLNGIAAPLDILNIDTDMIIPKQFLKTIKRSGLGKNLFHELRYDLNGNIKNDFVLNWDPFKKSTILVTGQNFGCGSSREHAPWSLLDFGIRSIISTSFADIFFNNCFKNGILPIVISQGICNELMKLANQKKIFKDKVIPKDLVFKSKYYIKECNGFSPKYKAWSNISGIDLIRNINGEYLVLEDNLRTPSGVSYMLENRMVMRDVFPELFTRYKVASIHQYTNKLFNCMVECIPKKTANPHMVVLTPGIYNSAYFEHSFLAEQMGIALVEGKDLFVEKDFVYMKTVTGPMKVDCIYRRIDDNFLDPKVFYKHSLLGVPGLFKCWRKGNVGIVNAPGTGIADDKAIYSYVDKMIKFYFFMIIP